jgi:hypothetical protein
MRGFYQSYERRCEPAERMKQSSMENIIQQHLGLSSPDHAL